MVTCHPWENIDMTFAEMKKMIRALLTGMEIEKVSEKTDGQNLNITWHNGQLVAKK